MTSQKLQQTILEYDYSFPPELIAQEPANPRDVAKILIYDRVSKKTFFDTFSNIGAYLPKNTVLVFNQTKVIPARLMITKPTGGRAEILYIDRDRHLVKVIANRKLLPGTTITVTPAIIFEVAKQEDQFYFLKPLFPIKNINAVLHKYGKTPLPPYIKHTPLNEPKIRKEYQSIFAKDGLSVAAPTASLHFTKNLVAKLKKQGIAVHCVTLNVNLGTFAPLKEKNLAEGTLHWESYSINKQTARALNQAKLKNKRIIAVGTTVVRTLESAAKNHKLVELNGKTNLFIRPGYKFQFVDGLITNYHVPKSSLLMLVSAFTGKEELLKLYRKSIEKRFRLFSFGDGMLVL
jgi:S-adenosylmethionine:tRNA ribosyltransferase-isomerase